MMRSCREVGLMASEYLDGELSWWDRLEFRLHVMMCRYCRRYLLQLRLTIRALRHLAEPNVARGNDQENIVRALIRERHGR